MGKMSETVINNNLVSRGQRGATQQSMTGNVQTSE